MLVDLQRWSEFISTHPESHILQDGRWGELKAGFGWQSQHLISGDAGTQILFRKLPFGYSIAYIPKGPVGFNKSLLDEIDELCRAHKSIFLKIEPFEWEPGNAWKELEKNGFVQGSPIQPRRTVAISLSVSEEDLLAGMKQKTRYNIRLAEKKDIVVRSSEDYQSFHKMAMETGERDNFGIHSLEYYLKLKENFSKSGQLVLLMAYFEEQTYCRRYRACTGQKCLVYVRRIDRRRTQPDADIPAPMGSHQMGESPRMQRVRFVGNP